MSAATSNQERITSTRRKLHEAANRRNFLLQSSNPDADAVSDENLIILQNLLKLDHLVIIDKWAKELSSVTKPIDFDLTIAC